MAPRTNDASGWGDFEEYEKGIMIEYPIGIARGVDTRTERRFSYVPQSIALSNWFRVVVPSGHSRTFYGETALSDARRYAFDKMTEARNASDRNEWVTL